VRSGVRPWIATTVASVFVLFGAGAQDIIWGFQISFTGALALGLVQLMLADHDGPIDRRDFLGIGAGLLALMCSNVAVTMIVVVGIATLLRRNWRAAALHTIPLGIVYVAWWERYAVNHDTGGGTARGLLTWFTTAGSALFGGLGEIPGFGWLLGVLLIVGLVVFVRRTGVRALREHASMPIALAIGALAFVGGAGIQRGDLGASFARQGRYVHVLAALLLPALALALDALLQRWRAVGVIGLAALVIGIPGNLLKADSFANRQRGLTASTHELILAIPRLPVAKKVPPTIRPEPDAASGVTVGWLLSGAASGRIPKPGPVSGLVNRTNNLRLSLIQTDGRSGYPCTVLKSQVVLKLNEGDKFGIRGTVSVVLWNGTSPRSLPVRFGSGAKNSVFAHTLVDVAGQLQIKVARGSVGFALVCLKDTPAP
jgi:hypothetical protein